VGGENGASRHAPPGARIHKTAGAVCIAPLLRSTPRRVCRPRPRWLSVGKYRLLRQWRDTDSIVEPDSPPGLHFSDVRCVRWPRPNPLDLDGRSRPPSRSRAQPGSPAALRCMDKPWAQEHGAPILATRTARLFAEGGATPMPASSQQHAALDTTPRQLAAAAAIEIVLPHARTLPEALRAGRMLSACRASRAFPPQPLPELPSCASFPACRCPKVGS
jgi:hypothetical protein